MMGYSKQQIEAVLRQRGIMPGEEYEEEPSRADIEVELKRRGIQLPSGMPSQEQQPEETMGWPGVRQDIMQKGGEFIRGLPEALRALPGEAQGAGHQLANEPGRAAKNLLGGLGEFGHGLLSKPGELRDYLVKKQLASKDTHSFRLPEEILPKEFNYPEAVGVEGQQAGDVLIQGVPGMLASPGELSALRKIPGLRSGSRHEKNLNKLRNEIEEKTQSHAEFLGHGQEHGARAAEEFMKHIEGETGIRKKVGSQYDKLSEEMSKENLMIEVAPDLKAIQKEIAKLGKGVSGEEREKLLKVLSKTGSKKQVSGADALSSYREIKHQKGQAYKNAYSPGENVNPKTREEWIKKGDDLDSLEKRMKKLISEQIGPDYLDKLKTIDKDYATKIAPLYKNPMYQEMLKHGQTSKNIMKVLHGTTPGNETLNAVVKKSPELQRLIVGQKFAAKPESLSAAGELVSPYKDMNSKISKIIKEQTKIQDAKKNKIPKLQESVQKARDRKNIRRGVVGTLGGIGGGIGVETALGRDWKEDIPLLSSLLALKRSGRK
jgi:hypothetical protein